MKPKRLLSGILVFGVTLSCAAFTPRLTAKGATVWPTVQYQAEGSQISHATGRLDGDGWLCQCGIDTANAYMVYGPYTTSLPAGLTQAYYTLKIDNNTANDQNVARIDVNDATTGKILAYQNLTRGQFTSAGSYQTFTMDFVNATAGDSLEFRVYWYGTSYVKVDCVGATSKSLRFEAEGSQVSHSTGRLESDGWLCQCGIDAANVFMIYGPYTTAFPAGAGQAVYRMKTDNITANNDDVAYVDVRDNTTGNVIASEVITRHEFNAVGTYQNFYLNFTQTDGHALEFRVYWYGNAYLKVDYVGASASNTHASWPEAQLLPSLASPVSNLSYIDLTSQSDDYKSLFTSLKSVVNKTQPRITTGDGNTDANGWLNNIGLGHTQVSDPYSLITTYAGEISGLVVYDPNQTDTLNLATTMAAERNALVVSPTQEATLRASPYNLPVLVDLQGQFSDSLAVYQYLYDNVWPLMSHRVLTGLNPSIKDGVRDYAAAIDSAVVWLDPRTSNQKTLLDKFFGDMNPGSAYMGWWPDENSGVSEGTAYGIATVASDWSMNLSVLGGTSRTINVPEAPAAPTLQNKIYVCFIMSDGDNMQYMEHRMFDLWNNSDRGSVPLGWTISPAAMDAMPGVVNWLYSTATSNDCLVCGPSGLGYAYPNNWSNATTLRVYMERTNAYCSALGLRVLTAWGSGVSSSTSDTACNAYASYATSLLGITSQNSGGSPAVYNGTMPNIPFGNSASYCTSTSNMQSAVNAGASKYSGSAPVFVAIQPVAWNFTPTDIKNFANGLGSNYVVVRPDQFFQLYRQYKGIS